MIPILAQNCSSDAFGEVFGAGCCGLFGLMYVFIWISAIALSLFFLIFKIMMIIDVARRKYAPGSSEQVVWILVIILVPIGSIIYFFVVKHSDADSPGIMPRKQQF